VPRFVPVMDTASGARWVGFAMLYLAVVTALLAAWAARRLHDWPV
jgi:hypothetical protein